MNLNLLAAVPHPIIYYGTQVLAWCFYPGYSFSQQVAGMLGTRYAKAPWILNSGIVLDGLAAVIGGLGLYRSYRRITQNLIGVLVGLSVGFLGEICIKAALFP